MKLIIRWLISTIAILITAYLLPGVAINGLIAALVLAIVIAAINIFIRPILVILTLPLTIFTLGIFLLVLNTLLIMLAAAVVPGVFITGFWSAFLFAIILSIVNTVLQNIGNDATDPQAQF